MSTPGNVNTGFHQPRFSVIKGFPSEVPSWLIKYGVMSKKYIGKPDFCQEAY